MSGIWTHTRNLKTDESRRINLFTTHEKEENEKVDSEEYGILL